MNTATIASARQSNAESMKRFAAPVAAFLLSLLPVLVQFMLHGYSSGHDLPFHLGSWQDAARQLHHGGYPQWDFAAAQGAGEPRFIFYPPISWLLGAALSSFLTPAHAAESFVLLALAASWLTMFSTARRYTTEAAAMIAAAIYVAGPYTLYNALERAAYGELLACAWLPLLFAAAVPVSDDSPLPKFRSIAIPLALLWLTNVPTAIIGSYLLVLLTALRLYRLRGVRGVVSPTALALRATASATLGLLLCGFFLFPALHQSHFVQLNAAFAEGQKYSDNFLLHHTVHTRRGNMHVVSIIAAEYVVPLAALLIALYARSRKLSRHATLLPALSLGAVATLFLLLPVSSLVWKYLPELSVLQFPWRLLCVLSLLASIALALAIAPHLRGRTAPLVVVVFFTWTLGTLGTHEYWLDPHRIEVDGRLRSDDAYDEQRRPTVEYTPAGADNATLLSAEPAYWLVANADDDASPSMLRKDTESLTPRHFTLHPQRPIFLVLKLRDYPSWTAEVNGHAVGIAPRADGRMALLLPAGADTVDIRWHRGWDSALGMLMSFCAALLLLYVSLRESVTFRSQRGKRA